MAEKTFGELNPPLRLLLGPGPSNVHPRVYRAMMAPVVGYLDPYLFEVLDDVRELLRMVFKTDNQITLPISGTGSAGMEAAIVNLIEPGDKVVVGVNGLFGGRMADVAARYGAEVVPVTAEWGRIIEPEAVRDALRQHSKVKAVALVHAETSTGVLQPLGEIGRIARERDALFIVDAVTSLGGCPVDVDAWNIDACYSCTQKCLSCPPGMAPLTVSDRGVKVVRERKSKVASFYFDLNLLENYWGGGEGGRRFYHHTVPMSMIYALREGLRVAVEEGLEARYQRHARNADSLQRGLEALGLTLHAQEGHRLPSLTSVRVPPGVDDVRVRGALLREYSIEIGGGLGALQGQVWRIGLMGYASSTENILYLLSSLAQALTKEGHRCDGAEAIAAALGI